MLSLLLRPPPSGVQTRSQTQSSFGESNLDTHRNYLYLIFSVVFLVSRSVLSSKVSSDSRRRLFSYFSFYFSVTKRMTTAPTFIIQILNVVFFSFSWFCSSFLSLLLPRVDSRISPLIIAPQFVRVSKFVSAHDSRSFLFISNNS